MKRSLQLLLAAVLAILSSNASPLSIRKAMVHIQDNLASASKTHFLSSTGMSAIDLTDSELICMKLDGFDALVIDADENPNHNCDYVKMHYRLYPEGQSPTSWTTFEATNHAPWWVKGDIGLDLLDGLTHGQAYRFEFYFEAAEGDSVFHFNNGGENYVIKFIPGDRTKPHFVSAGVVFSKNDAGCSYYFIGGNRDPESELGIVNSLQFNSSILSMFIPDGITLRTPTLTLGIDSEWVRQEEYVDVHTQMGVTHFFMDNVGIDLLTGLAEGEHTVKIYFQATDLNGNEYTLGLNDPRFEITFTYAKGSSGVKGDLNGDGKVDVSDLNEIIGIILSQ